MKKLIVLIFFAFSSFGVVPLVTQSVYAANNTATCAQSFLTFPVWYRGLTVSDTNCDIASPSGQNGISNFIWHVVLNVIEDALMLVTYVTVFFILYGGFQFLTSQGTPDAAAKARTTILNAVIGLVISLVAVGVVNFVVTGILK